ncbi:MAG: O-methyltransferase [Saprospiraceae bacterium]|nr:O-methyltransferase [Saprospiraceae bacterium]
MRETSQLSDYLLQHTGPIPALLQELERETHLKTLAPQMLCGSLVGRFLSLISRLVHPRSILEIGTFTGYGTLCLAEGLSDAGRIFTIEGNAEVIHISKHYFEQSPYAGQITQLVGDALEILPMEDQIWDLVFIDAAKKQYTQYYKAIIDQLRSGGILIADNVLWDGKVLEDDQSEETVALRKFNEMIQQDPRVENLMLSLRDGLMVCQKI